MPLPPPAYHLFYGTFIHLPRKPNTDRESGQCHYQHALEVNQGALWVSIDDGRIKGFECGLHGDHGLARFLERMRWSVVPSDVKVQSEDLEEDYTGYSNGAAFGASDAAIAGEGIETVTLFRAKEEDNEFFFPGFVGLYKLDSYQIYCYILFTTEMEIENVLKLIPTLKTGAH